MKVLPPILLVVLATQAAAQAPPAPSPSFEIAFWAGPSADKDPRVVTVYDHHACSGKVAIARVTSMPPYSVDAVLQPELAVELSHAAKIVRRWSLPVDRIVAAVSGDDLIVPTSLSSSGEEALAISAGGTLRLTTVPTNVDYGKLVHCPQISEWRDSAYLRCFEFKDLVSGKTRRIAYQGPCT